MKSLAVGLIAIVYGALAAGAPPRAQGGWSGTTGYVLATTDNDRIYTCNYTVVVTYTDGTTNTTSGQTQPTTGGTNLRAVEVPGSKTVAGVSVSNWDCR